MSWRFKDNRMLRGPFGIPMYEDLIDDINSFCNSNNFTYAELFRQGSDLLISQWNHEQHIKAKRARQSKRRYFKIRQAFEAIRNIQNNALKKALMEEEGIINASKN